jgi:hypothetical protein
MNFSPVSPEAQISFRLIISSFESDICSLGSSKIILIYLCYSSTIIIIIIISLSYLLTCKIKTPDPKYKVNINKKKETTNKTLRNKIQKKVVLLV